MNCRIVTLCEKPELICRAAAWFSSQGGISAGEYEKSMNESLSGKTVPQWFLALDSADRIVGGCGLIANDFVDRTEFTPYLCALFVEERARGNKLGALLLQTARKAADRAGFPFVYLCTDHTSYYERYGWEWIGYGGHSDGSSSRLYRASSVC